ncbi:hypothetical protein BGZ76_009909 [Entomortierella beljakovae]|nr:hypothetical protein BGZ76_009909 [Entomortierella beljakovae]
MLGPSPGPAPPPSLTLPPLRELDKMISPETDHNRIPIHSTSSSGQPRSQSSDPHLHQHFHQQRSQHGQPSSQNQYSQQQNGSPKSHGYSSHDQASRYSSVSGSLPDLYMSSSSAPPSTATSSSLSRIDSISTMEYLQNNTHDHSQRRRSSGGGGSSMSPSDLNEQRATSTTSTSNSTTGTSTGANGKLESANSKSAAAEQGRNTSKRAAQNRAAQRAFRQRKDLYVRELERKAELLQVAESQLISLAARNRELEALFASQQQSSNSSPLPSPLPPQDGLVTGMVGVAGNMGRGSERDWEREREWANRERSFDTNGHYDHFHGSRPAIGRHSSAQHLRQAYSASSPPLSSSSIKHLSLNSKLAAAYQQRPESDQEIEMHGRPQRQLHRHPSESSLNLSRTTSFTTIVGDGKDDDFPGASRGHNYRTPMEMESPTSSSKSPLSGSSGPFHDSPAHHYPGSPISPTHERMSLYPSRENLRAAAVSSGSIPSPNGIHSDANFNYDTNKKRPSDEAVNWTGPDLYRNPQDGGHSHPYHQAVKKQSSWSSLSEQRRLHTVKKQPSWGSISEHRHHWRTNTDSPEMSDASRFGGAAPALPRIPPQFSQRPPAPPQRSSFEREVSPSSASAPAAPGAAPFSYSPPNSSQQSQHGWQSSEYYSHARGAQHEPSHGPSDMDVEGSSYSREYEESHYEVKREERSE